jgi:hypothetical protein
MPTKSPVQGKKRKLTGSRAPSGPVRGRKAPGQPCGDTFISASYNCSPDKKKKAADRLRGTPEARELANKYRKFKNLKPIRENITAKYDSKLKRVRSIKDPAKRLAAAEKVLMDARKNLYGRRVNRGPGTGSNKASGRTGTGAILAAAKKEVRSARTALANQQNQGQTLYPGKAQQGYRKAGTAGQAVPGLAGTKWAHISVE